MTRPAPGETCPTCLRAVPVERRTYTDRAESLRRQSRARARGFTGPGAFDRYRAAIRSAKPITPQPPDEDVLWAWD